MSTLAHITLGRWIIPQTGGDDCPTCPPVLNTCVAMNKQASILVDVLGCWEITTRETGTIILETETSYIIQNTISNDTTITQRE